MTDLPTIAPSTTAVALDGGKVEVRGISLRYISSLIEKYPALTALFTKGEFNLDLLAKESPDAAACVVARGMRVPFDEKFNAWFDELTLKDQDMILGAIWAKSYPVGAGPFAALASQSKSESGASDEKSSPHPAAENQTS